MNIELTDEEVQAILFIIDKASWRGDSLELALGLKKKLSQPVVEEKKEDKK